MDLGALLSLSLSILKHKDRSYMRQGVGILVAHSESLLECTWVVS